MVQRIGDVAPVSEQQRPREDKYPVLLLHSDKHAEPLRLLLGCRYNDIGSMRPPTYEDSLTILQAVSDQLGRVDPLSQHQTVTLTVSEQCQHVIRLDRYSGYTLTLSSRPM